MSDRKVMVELDRADCSQVDSFGNLAGGIAHDFGNLLSVIMTYADLTLEFLPSAHPVCSNIQGIKKTAQRAASLSRQLLYFAQHQTIEPECLKLNDLIFNLEELLSVLIGPNIELVTRYAPDLGWVKVDSGQIERALVNLAINACDAMPKGGKLTLETAANVSLDQAITRQGDEPIAGRYMLLTVSDTGMGMTEAVKAHIFEPFFTTKSGNKGEGGLGLAIVADIINQNGGHILVNSQPDQGTTFKIYLPYVKEPTFKTRNDHSPFYNRRSK